jgi:hypothetical protein
VVGQARPAAALTSPASVRGGLGPAGPVAICVVVYRTGTSLSRSSEVPAGMSWFRFCGDLSDHDPIAVKIPLIDPGGDVTGGSSDPIRADPPRPGTCGCLGRHDPIAFPAGSSGLVPPGRVSGL